MCSFLLFELVLLGVAAVNFCLGGCITPGVLVSLSFSKLSLDAVRADVDLAVLMKDDKNGSKHKPPYFTRTCCPSFLRTLAGPLHLLLEAHL